MAETPPHDPPRRRTPKTPAVRASPPGTLSPEPITEGVIPQSADGAFALRDVEYERVINERRRDRHGHVREVLVVLVLLVLMGVGATFVMADKLSAETYMGYFAAGCVGAIARGSVRRT